MPYSARRLVQRCPRSADRPPAESERKFGLEPPAQTPRGQPAAGSSHGAATVAVAEVAQVLGRSCLLGCQPAGAPRHCCPQPPPDRCVDSEQAHRFAGRLAFNSGQRATSDRPAFDPVLLG
eukprot:12925456-Alexandrium_andersonii.AAC.1